MTRAQMVSVGLSSAAIDRRLAAGECQRLHSGVYLLAGHPITPAVRLRAAVFSAGSGAFAWGPSAAWWSGLLDRVPHRIWITVPRERRLRQHEWKVRRRDVHRSDITTHRGLRITSTDLTVLETAALLEDQSSGRGMTLLDRALQTSTTVSRLHEAHQRNLGRTGSARCTAMLARVAEGGESHAEREFLSMVRAANLTGWVSGFRSCGYVIDVAFPAERVAIEIDGWAFHRTAERMANDAKRQNRLVAAGWTVLRFTYHRLVQEPDAVIAEVRRALAADRGL